MTKQELIDIVTQDITASCSLPFAPSPAEIERLIDIESKTLFREYRDLQQNAYYILDKKWYSTDAWKSTRTYQMPECCLGIKTIFELTGGQRAFGIHDPDMNFDRIMAADLYLSPLSSDQITYRTIQWSFWDLAKQFNLRDIQHGYNINTHRLIIIGRDPDESLWIQTLNKIPDEDAYEDPIFIRWITAKSKIQLAKMLGTFQMNLLGNVTINFADIRTEGQEELQECKDKIASDSPPDWFVLFS